MPGYVPVLMILYACSMIMLMAVGMWIVATAFRISNKEGFLCWFVPVYPLYFLVSKSEDEDRWIMVFLLLGSAMLLGLSIAILGVSGHIDVLLGFNDMWCVVMGTGSLVIMYIYWLWVAMVGFRTSLAQGLLCFFLSPPLLPIPYSLYFICAKVSPEQRSHLIFFWFFIIQYLLWIPAIAMSKHGELWFNFALVFVPVALVVALPVLLIGVIVSLTFTPAETSRVEV